LRLFVDPRAKTELAHDSLIRGHKSELEAVDRTRVDHDVRIFQWPISRAVPMVNIVRKSSEKRKAKSIGARTSRQAASRQSGRSRRTPNGDIATALSVIDQLGMVSVCDLVGRITHVNEAFSRVSQYARNEILGENHSILNSGHHDLQFWNSFYKTIENGETWRGAIRNRAKDGTFYWVDTIAASLADKSGTPDSYISLQFEKTAGVEARGSLDDRNGLLHAIIESFPGGLAIFDRDLRSVVMNAQQKLLFSYTAELFQDGPPTFGELDRFSASRGEFESSENQKQYRDRILLARNGDSQTFERRRPDGSYVEVRATALPDGGILATHIDITDRKRDKETIVRLEHLDGLTGLANRNLFVERARKAFLETPGKMALAVHCIDIDGLKSINDTLGYQVGDELLIAIGKRLKELMRPSDTLARTGGDEFAVIQASPDSIEAIESLAKSIILTCSEPFLLGAHTVSVGVTIGISVGPMDGDLPDVLAANADIALSRTKSIARGTFGFFEQSMHQRLQKRRQIIMGLHEALANSKFELHYQPIVNVKSRRIVGCEALIRWSHPISGLIPASEFIPIAEECGLINQIGEWVLRRACAEASLWPDDIWVAVNISPSQFRDKEFIGKVTSAAHNLPLSRLILEVTETLLMNDQETALNSLERLRGMGVRFSIDDFGTGFSSLSYLQSFPFDKIKIDRSFVSSIANAKRSATLRRSIIQLGYNLGMTSVAEGVETEQQLDLLRAEGCVEAQGYLFSRAVPAAKLRTLFANCL
jgi:diguanylate cyclase (GGDEF)-like protein/PAS domain S-box-containing protein